MGIVQGNTTSLDYSSTEEKLLFTIHLVMVTLVKFEQPSI